MANALYTVARNIFGTTGLGVGTNTFRVYIIDTGAYTFSAAHTQIADVPSGARIGNTNLASVTFGSVAAGVFDAADVDVTAGSATSVEAVIIYDVTNDRLIAYLDTGITGLPATPAASGTVSIVWNASGIFSVGG